MKLANIHVLLAEDSEDDVFLFERALKMCGILHSLFVAKEGTEVLKYLRGRDVMEIEPDIRSRLC
ncbi:MAG: hypothetical protein ACK4UN_00805 [Limisphaerales bacterium]